MFVFLKSLNRFRFKIIQNYHNDRPLKENSGEVVDKYRLICLSNFNSFVTLLYKFYK